MQPKDYFREGRNREGKDSIQSYEPSIPSLRQDQECCSIWCEQGSSICYQLTPNPERNTYNVHNRNHIRRNKPQKPYLRRIHHIKGCRT